MHIVHLVPTALEVPHDLGGAVQRRALAMAEEQAARGHQVTIFSPGGRTQLLGLVSVEALRLQTRRPVRDLEYLWKARRRVAEIRPSVVHSHGLPFSARVLGGGPWVNIHTVDFIYYAGSKSRLGKVVYAWALAGFEATAAVSEYCREEFLTYHPAMRGRRVEVIYNGVDLKHFAADETTTARVREKFGLTDYVLYVGRVNEQKGCDLLAPLPKALPVGYELVIAGPSGQFGVAGRSALVGALEGAGARYLGPVEEADLVGLMSGADLLVLPTRRHEMFGMVLVEAGACGVPSVASRLGGIPEALGSGGRTFEAGNSREMVQSVVELLEVRSERTALAERALLNARRFDWVHIVDDYARLGASCR